MKKTGTCIILFLIAISSCKEKFIPSLQSPATGYLVVEGFINSGDYPTTIKLTRTTKVYDSLNIVYENNATVNILGENNEVFPLIENGNGSYLSSVLNLNENEKYRLQIKTQDGKEFLSDFTTVKHTPEIDSISYTQNNDGLKIYVNTHDALGKTKYYKWDYVETWEFHSAYLSILEYARDPATNAILGVGYRNMLHEPDTTIFKCWKSNVSKNIIIGSSEKLTADVIYLPISTIEAGSQRLSVLYSILVRQYAISHEAYLYYDKIKKNTEQLGSIFDPQPSALQGNIHCTTNPQEPVVGFVDVSQEKDERIFIKNSGVPGWNYDAGCQLVLIKNQADSINSKGAGTIPTSPKSTFGLGIIDFYASSETCVDCTLTGSNIKPSFWP